MIVNKTGFNINLEKEYVVNIKSYTSITSYKDKIILKKITEKGLQALNKYNNYKDVKVFYSRWFKYDSIQRVVELTKDNYE